MGSNLLPKEAEEFENEIRILQVSFLIVCEFFYNFVTKKVFVLSIIMILIL